MDIRMQLAAATAQGMALAATQQERYDAALAERVVRRYCDVYTERERHAMRTGFDSANSN